MSKVLSSIKAVLADVAKLQNKHLAASIVAWVVAAVAPFGINLGAYGGPLLAVIATVSAVAAVLEKLFIAQPVNIPPKA